MLNITKYGLESYSLNNLVHNIKHRHKGEKTCHSN